MLDWLPGLAGSVVQVVVGLGLLIFVHELGHFVVAKLVGVRIEEFCLGFGPKIVSWRRGATVYGVCWVPLGGYIKMAGQRDFQADQGITGAPDEYTSKTPLQRAGIIVAGPAMNIVFAFVVLVVGFMVGIEFIPPLVGKLSEESPAFKAGLREGDRFVSVGGKEVERFQDITRAVAFGGAAGTVRAVVRREGVGRVDLMLPVAQDQERRIVTVQGLALPTRRIRIGCELARGVLVAQVIEGSPAEDAGIRRGDILFEAGGERLEEREKLQEAVKASAGRPLELGAERDEKDLAIEVTPRIDPEDGVPRIGVVMEMVTTDRVDSVVAGSPSSVVGIRPGDRIKSLVLRRDGKVAVVWFRGGERMGRDLLRQMPEDAGSPEIVHEILRVPISLGFIEAASRSAREMVSLTVETFMVLWGVITRKFSPKVFSGPVSIIQYTFMATRPGPGYYLWFVAVISTSLGVLNLLPIPVLDGGHMVFIAAEGLRGRPLGRKVIEYSQVVGLILILTLVVFLTFNDVKRIIIGTFFG